MRTKFYAVALFVALAVGVSFAGSIYTPVSHWAFDETSGTTVSDSGTGGYNGTVYGNPVWASGQVGGCLDFDGNGDYVNFGDIDAFEFGSSNFTISFWMKTEGSHDIGGEQSGKGDIIAKYNIEAGRQWIFQQTDDGKINFATYHSNSMYGGDGLVSTEGYFGEWVHVIGVRNGTTKYLYINGVLNNTASCTDIITGCSTQLRVGCIYSPQSSTYNYQFFNGKIDEIRIYDYALSANEAYQLYTIPEPVTFALFGTGALLLRRRK